MSTSAPSQDELIEQALVEAAREDPITFNDYVLRDEKGGAPIESCGMHREWQRKLDTHKRVQLISHIESGKSFAVAVGRVLYELGRDPDLRVVLACNTAGQASKLLGVVAHYIEHSAELHRVFPRLKREPGGFWNQTAISVVRSAASKDPSVQAVGLHGNVLGARCDLLVCDDICDFENSRTESARADLDQWLRSTLLGRLTQESRAWVLGNVWHEKDQYASFEKSGWKTYRYPITDFWGRPRWPQRWPASYIADKRKDLGPRESARQLDCRPPNDADPLIATELINNMVRLGAEAGATGFEIGHGFSVLGCDFGYSEKASSDPSALVLVGSSRPALGMRPPRHIMQVISGRWGLDEIVRRIVDTCTTSKAIAAIESNAGGEYIAQQVEKTRVPVVRMPTTASSKKLRVDMLTSELNEGRWILNQPGFMPPEAAALVKELHELSYEDHFGDRAMALLLAVEAIRKHEIRPKGRCFDASFLMRR